MADFAGVDALMVFPFGAALASVSPKEFVEHWLAGAGGVVTGENFIFGRGRSGDVRSLAEFGKKQDLVAATVGPVLFEREVVSSTRIRDALRDADCATATRLLSRPFTVEGVLSGAPARHAGHGLRAAIGLGAYLRPAPGLYAVRVQRANGDLQDGTARMNPTPTASRERDSLELFLAGAEHHAFDERIEVAFINKF